MRILYSLVFLFSFILIAKTQDLQATEEEALITFQILDESNAAVTETAVQIVGVRKGFKSTIKTDKQGEIKVLLPVSDEYKVLIKGCSNDANFELPDAPYLTHTIQIPFVAQAVQVVGESISNSKATETEALLLLRLQNKEAIALQDEKIIVEAKKTKKTYTGSTNKEGIAEILVPINDLYFIHLDKAPMYYSIAADATPYLTMDETLILDRHPKWELYPRIDKALLTFYFEDLDNVDIEDEVFIIKDLNTEKEYQCTTNTKGVAQIYVPINHRFEIKTPNGLSTKKMDTQLLPENNVVYKEINYTSLSTEARALRMAKMARASEIRDSLYLEEVALRKKEMEDAIAKSDSIRAASAKLANEQWKQQLKENTASISSSSLFYRLQYNSEDTLYSNEFMRRANEKKKAYKKDPLYFEQQKEIVLAILARLSSVPKTKVVVTDITGSMYKYMVEVMFWHAMDFDEGQQTKYLFFNDGDHKIHKPIGNTGGLYYCEGKFKDFNHIVKTLSKGMAGGGGGDGPENDLEALLEAVTHLNNIDELILVADNYSPVRDIKLLKELKVPVRIIVCGSENKANINPQYLTIAYQTGGSVHTLKKDILDLEKIAEGKSITINGIRYILQNGEFISQKRI